MKIIVAILIVVCATFALADDDSDWQEFKIKHGKAFLSKNTESRRKAAFTKHNKNVKELQALADAGEISYSVTLYSFHDMEPEEILERMTGLVVPEKPDPNIPVYRANVHARASFPDSYDARNYVAFNTPRNQGQCGSCWTFSTINSLETVYAKRKGTPVDLSEQQLVDCVYNYDGCRGGMMDDAFNYLARAGGSVEEYLYQYNGVSGTCRTNNPVKAKVIGPVKIGSDEASIKSAIMELGSISVCVDASQWSYYHNGVLKKDYAGQINHAVNMVGWGNDPQYGPYWIIRNSWGPDWGENGYIRISTAPGGSFNPNWSFSVELAY